MPHHHHRKRHKYHKAPTETTVFPADKTEKITHGHRNNTTYQPSRYTIKVDRWGYSSGSVYHAHHGYLRWYRPWSINGTLDTACNFTITIANWTDGNDLTYHFTNTTSYSIDNIKPNDTMIKDEDNHVYVTVRYTGNHFPHAVHWFTQQGNYKLKFTQDINRTRDYELRYINGSVNANLTNYNTPPNVSFTVNGETHNLTSFDFNCTSGFAIHLSIVSNCTNFTLRWDVNATAVHRYHFPILTIYTNIKDKMLKNETLELNISIDDGSFPIGGLDVNVEINNDTVKSISKGRIYQYNLTVDPNTNGILVWNVTATDTHKAGICASATEHGNTTTIRERVEVKTPPDTTDPTLTILSPENGTIMNTTNITVRWQGNDNRGINHYAIRLDNGVWMSTNKILHQFQVGQGRHTVTVKAVDNAGNSVTKIIRFTVDTTRPTLTILSPENGTTTNTTVTVKWQSDDNRDIDHYAVRLDDGAWIRTNRSSHEFQVKEGNHTVAVKVFDGAGNTVTKTIHFTVKSSTPSEGGAGTGSSNKWSMLKTVLSIIAIAAVACVIIVVIRRFHSPPDQTG